MKKIILTLCLSLSFLFTFGNEVKNEKTKSDVFNCWVRLQTTVLDIVTGEMYTYSWWQWAGYAGTEEVCKESIKKLVDSLN